MNIKIGELVEYVEVLKARQAHKFNRMDGVIKDLVAIKKELEEQADGDAQLIKNLELQLKITDERVVSCEKCFKELEATWGKRDQNIIFWFKVNNYPEDMAKNLLRFLLETR